MPIAAPANPAAANRPIRAAGSPAWRSNPNSEPFDASQATPIVTSTAPIHPSGSSPVPMPTAPRAATISTSDFE